MTNLNYEELPIFEELVTVEFTDIELQNTDIKFMEIFILRSENGLYELSSPETTNDGEKIYLGTDIIVRLYQFNTDDHFLFYAKRI